MDPVETSNERVTAVKESVSAVLKELDPRLSLHDFRMVDGEHQINLIFDVVAPHAYQPAEMKKLSEEISAQVKKLDARYECVLTIEKSYVAEA